MNNLKQHILAAYYNDARLNILFCLNDIREKNGDSRVANEDQLSSIFDKFSLTTATPERQSKLIKQLRYRFPFIDVLTDPPKKKNTKEDSEAPTPEKYDKRFKWVFKLVKDLRNTMVHPTNAELMLTDEQHKNIFHSLKPIYDASLGSVKTRFELDTKIITPLLRCNKKGKSKPVHEFCFTPCLDPNKNNTNELKQSHVIYDFGHVLFCALFLDKSQSAELMSYFWQAGYDKKWNVQQQNIIKELVSIYRIRLPIQRLQSDNTETSVTLDTLSELSRCPRKLLDTLSPADQQRFRGGSSLLKANQITEDLGDEPAYLYARGHEDRFIPLIMRFFDFDPNNKLRFAIDLGQFYYNVRLKPADQYADDKSRVRRIGQKVIGYGRLIQFETAIKPENWTQLEQNYTTAIEEEQSLLKNASQHIEVLNPYMIKCSPHYHYTHDKIGFRIAQPETLESYPDLKGQRADDKQILNAIPSAELAPEFWISPNQLIHFAFYTHLSKTNPKALPFDKLLLKYRSGMIKLLKNIETANQNLAGVAHSEERRVSAQQWVDQCFKHAKGGLFSVTLSDLPNVVVQHLLGAGTLLVSKEKIIQRVEHLQKETTQKIKQIEYLLQGQKKRGKKGFKPIKCGQIGDFLVDDLMRFQPINKEKSDGGKLNSQHYQILQKTIAYYGAHIDEPPKIVDLLINAGLLKGDFAHPFLAELNLIKQPNQFSGLVSFYQAYLKKRANFLQQSINTIRQKATIIELPHWLGLKQHSNLKNWLKDYQDDQGEIVCYKGQLKQPLPIPSNWLYPPIFDMVAKETNLSAELLYQKGVQHVTRMGEVVEIRPAFNWLIKHYFAHQNDDSQMMYRYARSHRLFDIFRDRRSNPYQEKKNYHLNESDRKNDLPKIRGLIKKFNDRDKISEKEESKKNQYTQQLKSYKHQEKQIRQRATQDRLLYLFAKNNLNKLQLSQNAPLPTWTLKHIEATLLSTAIIYKLPVPNTTKVLFHPECKVKNLGAIRLLACDRRLPSLFAYYSPDEIDISYDEVRAELISYRRSKVEIMKKVHELEKKIMQYYGDKLPKDKQHGHCQFLEVLKSVIPCPTALDFEKALKIRNALSHNEYPEITDFDLLVAAVRQEKIPKNPANHRKIAEKLLEALDCIYQPWLKHLS